MYVDKKTPPGGCILSFCAHVFLRLVGRSAPRVGDKISNLYFVHHRCFFFSDGSTLKPLSSLNDTVLSPHGINPVPIAGMPFSLGVLMLFYDICDDRSLPAMTTVCSRHEKGHAWLQYVTMSLNINAFTSIFLSLRQLIAQMNVPTKSIVQCKLDISSRAR